MKLTCGNCGQDMPDNSAYTPIELAEAIESVGNWEGLVYAAFRQLNPTNRIKVPLRGNDVWVTVVEKIEPKDMPSNEYDRQGETYKAFLILEVDGTYYRKEAHVDSYADESWTGPVTRVNRIEKTVQVWE
jgi:hypothetical protein